MDTQVKPGTPFRKALLMHGILTQLAAQFKGLALQQAVGRSARMRVAAKVAASTAVRNPATGQVVPTPLTAYVSVLVASVR